MIMSLNKRQSKGLIKQFKCQKPWITTLFYNNKLKKENSSCLQLLKSWSKGWSRQINNLKHFNKKWMKGSIISKNSRENLKGLNSWSWGCKRWKSKLIKTELSFKCWRRKLKNRKTKFNNYSKKRTNWICPLKGRKWPKPLKMILNTNCRK